jgi:hypothetical protein
LKKKLAIGGVVGTRARHGAESTQRSIGDRPGGVKGLLQVQIEELGAEKDAFCFAVRIIDGR